MHCWRWDEERMRLLDGISMPTQRRPVREELFGRILEKAEYWRYFREFAEVTLEIKEDIERAFDREEQTPGAHGDALN